jgi:hypothetical protein
MVDEGAGAGKAEASVVIVDAGIEEVVDADQIRTSSMAMMTKLLEPAVQVIWLIMNMRPTIVAMESGKMTISHD